jgi:nicotinate-nucleotide--dimethylbenzimidazole phosphoribosyltransferase
MLELGLQFRLRQRADRGGSTGELEALALRLGLLQGNLKPRFWAPQLLVFAADHGLAVEGIRPHQFRPTVQTVTELLRDQLPLAAFARAQGIGLGVVDCGVAEPLAGHPALHACKVAHGSRSARLGPAMSAAQVQTAIRNGMALADALPGNVLMCAGMGTGGLESAALVVSALTGIDVAELVATVGASRSTDAALLAVLHTALERHRGLVNPVDLLAALGGYDTATMLGAILVAARRRHLVVLDGLPAYAAFLVAVRLAPDVRGYGLCCHSHAHPGLLRARSVLDAAPLLELGLDSLDGTGATLAWPLLACAAALLSDVAEPEGVVPPEAQPGTADQRMASDLGIIGWPGAPGITTLVGA